MNRGFVFGKFMPFHKGHEAMIRFALSVCDELTVLICCSTKETIPAATRKHWIESSFAASVRIRVTVFEYDETLLPNTSETDAGVAELWAAQFSQLLPGRNIVVTSEPYGDLVAGFMGIRHIPFNMEKDLFPVSATKIRADLWTYWEYLPDAVKRSYITKVVLLGTESTGKTTLAMKLAAHFNANAVMEAGRELIPDSNHFSVQDLYKVADAHAASITAMMAGNSPLLIIDTDIHTTISYAAFTFNETLQISPSVFAANKAALYLYLNNDVPYYQDGTRLSEKERNLLDASHRQVLTQYGISYVEISGDWDQRFAKAVELVNALITS
ncbi:AAA family ATPase [Chitinophaga agrisoli]|uniref:AAA family ATPase n=1 Tax=Chitinophaga agrisoli TaxID=2607653 RepID=A0A5B2VX60_9BACT|nr:AAA family ATPase [Chitinophaga agrisoli]KAA2243364.1 AAA family ATPase [Chitinophaga agrisoli]